MKLAEKDRLTANRQKCTLDFHSIKKRTAQWIRDTQCELKIIYYQNTYVKNLELELEKLIALLSQHYHLEVQANPKKLYKKSDVIFSINGRNGIIPWHFKKILIWAFRGCWGRIAIKVEFWGCHLEILKLFLKVWFLTFKR